MQGYRIPDFQVIDKLASVVDSHGKNIYATTTIRTEHGRVIQAEVARDFYPHQSRATARLLTDDGSWNTLLTDPPNRWHPDTNRGARTQAEVSALLNPIINGLLTRAVTLARTADRITGTPPHRGRARRPGPARPGRAEPEPSRTGAQPDRSRQGRRGAWRTSKSNRHGQRHNQHSGK